MADFEYMLAPVEDMTSNAFRTICHRYGADLTFTEMTRVEGLARKNKSTWSRIDLKDDTPTVIQLLGAKEFCFKKFLSMFEPPKGFKGFNLNVGCPNPQVVKLGQGCAIIEIFRDHSFPASIKMRLGINKKDKENKAYLHLIEAVDADFFVVHARYGSQTYAEPADFSVYEECVRTGRNIIANGDIKTKEQAESLKGIGVKGVMVGRAAILDPSIFNKLKGVSSPDLKIIMKEYMELSKNFDEPFKYSKNIIKHMGKSASIFDMSEE